MYVDKGSCDLSIPLKYLNVNTSVKHRNESTVRHMDEVLFKIYLTCLNSPPCFFIPLLSMETHCEFLFSCFFL